MNEKGLLVSNLYFLFMTKLTTYVIDCVHSVALS